MIFLFVKHSLGIRLSQWKLTMIFENNQLTEEYHNYKRRILSSKFSELENCDHNSYLSFWKYLNDIPDRFYSKNTAKMIFEWYVRIQKSDDTILASLLKKHKINLNMALERLDKMNQLKFHDRDLSSDSIDAIKFVDNYINPNYLKLIEGVYANFILPMSDYERIKRNANLEGFDLFNRVQELKRNKSFIYLTDLYNNTMRNAIAHGGIIYNDREIVYKDRKNTSKYKFNEVISFFDNTIDMCNGLALGMQLYFVTENKFIEKNRIVMPLSMLRNELISQANAPGWTIKDCIQGEFANGKKQLIIYTKNHILDPIKLYYMILRSVILAESFIPNFDRYFFRIESRYSLDGWAGYDGKILKKIRISKSRDIGLYKEALENDMIFFVPIIKLPRLLFQLVNFITIIKMLMAVKWNEFKEEFIPLSVDTRKINIHRQKYRAVIHGSVILTCNDKIPLRNLIQTKAKYLIKKSVKSARKSVSIISLLKYLPIGFIKLNVYTRDFRIRDLGNSGLIPDLICTIEYNRLKEIQTIDIYGGIPQVIDDIRIVWNINAISDDD